MTRKERDRKALAILRALPKNDAAILTFYIDTFKITNDPLFVEWVKEITPYLIGNLPE